ncbi:MAG: hypothetical protein JSV03_03870 [Planctomycetota bacterium]|nr:MAG: hypothetical protein JSV03_03870 [Planctomycetota bacterium]
MSQNVFDNLVAGLKEIDSVRPRHAVPAWINSLLKRIGLERKQVKLINAIWDKIADDFFKIPFVSGHNKWWKFNEPIDKLRLAFFFSRGASIRNISRLITRIYGLRKKKVQSHYQDALNEAQLNNQTARFVIHGHTHRYENVPLDTCMKNGHPFNQMYFNTGTWRPVHELAARNPKEEEFIDFNVMTYVAIYKDDERAGRKFETWSGALG